MHKKNDENLVNTRDNGWMASKNEKKKSSETQRNPVKTKKPQ